MLFHEPAEISSGQGSVRNDADVGGPVGDFPGFPVGLGRGQGFAIELFDVASAPGPRLEDGFECERVKHGRSSEGEVEFRDASRLVQFLGRKKRGRFCIPWSIRTTSTYS